jgi:nucleotide-binding universal stress UspA family protein
MRKVQSILLATDYRAASKEALRVAAKMARSFDASVWVLHVVQGESPAMLVLRKQLSEESQKACLDELESRQVRIAGASFAFGSPADRIVRRAQELDADIVVMGAGELRERQTFIAGPTATSVIQRARQPVLAVRPASPGVEFRRILCPIDFSPVSRRGLQNAICLTRAFNGELVVLSVVPEVSWLGAAVETGVLAGAKEQHAAHWETEFERFLQETDFAGVTWTRELVGGTPAREIAESARRTGADLIVMGTTGHAGLARLMMGSVTQRVLQDLPCSILTMHDEGLFAEEPDEEDLRVSRLLFAEAEALLSAKSYQPALEKLDQALMRNPFHVLALHARARACEALGQTDRAKRCLRRAEILTSEASVSP